MEGVGSTGAERGEFDTEESLHLSGNPPGIDRREEEEPTRTAASETTLSSETNAWSETSSSDVNDSSMSDPGQQSATDRGQPKPRSGKNKPKAQRSATDAGGNES
jgi:hypothetical protein